MRSPVDEDSILPSPPLVVALRRHRNPPDGTPFDPALVADLPEPARRYLLHAIAPGTPLARSVELEMEGTILLAPGGEPVPITAEQVLSPPEGFIWRARTHGGLMRIRGFDRYVDGQGEMRWRLWGLIPVLRADGPDITRSAAARLAMEAVMSPSALIPGRGAEWEPVDEDRAVFRMRVGEERVETTLTVDAVGRPVRVSAPRWREASGSEPAGYSRFDVEMEGELRSGGYTLPGRIRAGWRLGEPDEFRFFDATLTTARFGTGGG